MSKDWVESTVVLTKGGVPMKLTEFVIKEAEMRFEATFKHLPRR